MQTLVAIALVDPMHWNLLIQKSKPVDILVAFAVESITTFGNAKGMLLKGRAIHCPGHLESYKSQQWQAWAVILLSEASEMQLIQAEASAGWGT